MEPAEPPARGASLMAAVAATGLSKGLAAIAAHKVAAVVVAAALIGGAGATVATGSANPVEWERQARAVVTQCKTERAPDEHGIGHCVSDSNDRKNDKRGDPTHP